MRVSRLPAVAGSLAVGFLASLRPGIGDAELTAAAALLTTPAGIKSPWASPGQLETIVLADIFGTIGVAGTVTRAEAIRVPAVARARHIICGTIARIDLRAYPGEDTTPLSRAGEPSWIGATDGPVSPLHRMLWTVDDLLFYGWSLWEVTQRSITAPFWPLRMARVPMGQWQLEPDTNRVLLYRPDGRGSYSMQPVPPRDVVLIPGPHEGLLSDGAPAVRHAADLQRSAHNAGRHPHAYLGLKQTSGDPLKKSSTDPDEVTIETLLASWRTARNNPEGGGVAWLGGVEPHEFGAYDAHMLTEGRNAAAVDIARHASIPSDLIDATVTESSLHYSTSRDNDRRAIDYGLGFYMSAISARLSQDDVTPRGQRLAFDLERWLAGAGATPGESPGAPAPGLATQQPTPAPATPSSSLVPAGETPA